MVARCVCDCLDARAGTVQNVHAYIISTRIGVEMSLLNETYVFHFSRERENKRTTKRTKIIGVCSAFSIQRGNTSTPLMLEICKCCVSERAQIDICVRIIIFNGCRVSRLTVLFVLLFCIRWQNFIVLCYIPHTCAVTTHTRTPPLKSDLQWEWM